ncbi:MAG TPA: type II toxin-antitoxin system VapB family antitoxin [Thermoanaerobaculia bacterium]|jgi:antitoxin VapB|nr:type II toxin-antitoxin system VapB family antitoxin [Thermoanaerobaculia bacterium]
MALTIQHPEAEQLAQELAEKTGESLTEAVVNSLRERLQREQSKREGGSRLRDEIRAIGKRCAALPVLDPRSPDEILGYDEHGLPH